MKRRGAGRPRGVKPETTRHAILAAAESCFSESGFAGTPTRRIAARAGVNVATLHYHFGSKEKLYVSVLGGADEKIAQSPFVDAPGSVAELVEALFDRARSDLRRTRLRALARFSEGDGADPRLELLNRALGHVRGGGATRLSAWILSLIDASALALEGAPPALVARARTSLVAAAVGAPRLP